MKKLLCGAVVALGVLLAGQVGARNAAPKKISEIMEEAHTPDEDSLRAMVLAGKAKAEGAKKLLALYQDLGKNNPPMGSKEAWKKRTDAIVAAARKVAEAPDDKAALAALTRATNCGA